MATLTVLKFPTAQGAENMLSMLQTLQGQQLIQIEDGAIVAWPVGASKPSAQQLSTLTGLGPLRAAFRGILFGFAAPSVIKA